MLRGTLFTRAFLEEGIKETHAWSGIEARELDAFRSSLTSAFEDFPTEGQPNEAQTFQDLIRPVLEALGWTEYLPEIRASRRGRVDVPDVLLFPDASAKKQANAETQPADYFQHGLAVVENKAWGRALDRAGPGRTGLDGVPSNQMLRYLSVVETQSEGRIRWGILTNGRLWRLYYQKARSRSEQFLEIDLAAVLGFTGPQADLFDVAQDSDHWVQVFYLLFRRTSFMPQPEETRTFHEIALAEGRHWEARITAALTQVVFHQVYPQLLTALAHHDPQAPEPIDSAYLAELRQAGLILLFRLLFTLYAEDRHLLPVTDTAYDDYGMRKRVREDVAGRIDTHDTFSDRRAAYYRHMQELARSINEGDPSIGLPAYNGGLFDPHQTPLLERIELPDAAFAPLVDALSRHEAAGTRKWINYRDLSVQHLGSIYEGLLEYEPVATDDGVEIRPQPLARKGSGSYYTPEDLVQLVIRETVGPLVDECVTAFEEQAGVVRAQHQAKAHRIERLREIDPATAILQLDVCDPAMGSGHFLVSLVDYLADRVLEAVASAELAVDWADADAPYASPLPERIAEIRERIQTEAERGGWAVRPDQLSDRNLVRRMILKRCVYGVDKNPMAVELAKVSLWLHTFTVGAPLSFLDHHLRVGDSLFGEWIRPLEDELKDYGAMFLQPSVRHARAAAREMGRVEELSDADIGEAHRSAELFRTRVEPVRQPLRAFLSLMHAWRWLDPRDKPAKQAFRAYIDGRYGDPVEIAAGATEPLTTPGDPVAERFLELLKQANEIIDTEEFLHWEVAYPRIWEDWERPDGHGGFDAVIGNPPWDRMKLQEVEWFATRRPDIARAQRASDRKDMIATLKADGDPLVSDYEQAAWRAEAAARVARSSRQYPLLGHGDLNIYSLFVEQSLQLIHSTGMVGLLTPSGIAGDRGASQFFSRIASSSRLRALYDFENGRSKADPPYFPDVHRSFKFSTLVMAGSERHFAAARCAFYLHSTDEIADPDKAFRLTAADFSNVNPNTGTAPIFRRARDAEITTSIYQRIPVFVDRRTTPPTRVWPVRYFTMLHMTNDSGRFRDRATLEGDGCYPVAGSRYRKGKLEFLPLYEGKMVQAFDHRAASVELNLDNVHRPAHTLETTAEQHGDPDWSPNPQYWVAESDISWPSGLGWVVAFKDVTAPTNIRTMIAAVIPRAAAGNTLPMILPDTKTCDPADALAAYKEFAPLLLANLNSFAYDYLARQKVQGQHLNWYIVEQIPVIPSERYDTPIGSSSARRVVRDEVLRLTFTAWDLATFAQDMGYQGAPFVWDEEDRRHRRARIDAIFFGLYGIGTEGAAAILETFPGVKARDEREFGRFRTKELVLGYMLAFDAGDVETRIAV